LTGWWLADAIILAADWLGRFTYSTWPARISGDSISATVDYEKHRETLINTYIDYYEITGVE
jgi:hypothetical protein